MAEAARTPPDLASRRGSSRLRWSARGVPVRGLLVLCWPNRWCESHPKEPRSPDFRPATGRLVVPETSRLTQPVFQVVFVSLPFPGGVREGSFAQSRSATSASRGKSVLAAPGAARPQEQPVGGHTQRIGQLQQEAAVRDYFPRVPITDGASAGRLPARPYQLGQRLLR